MVDMSVIEQQSVEKGHTGVVSSTASVVGHGEVTEITPTKKTFSTLNTLALAVTLLATWEGLCASLTAAVNSGGPVSLVYGYILAFVGTLATMISLAEPASMWPVSGGQFQIMAELSSPSWRPVLEWYSGWVSALGWIAFAGSCPFLGATMSQGLAILNNPDYTPERWQGTMIYWLLLFIAFVINRWGFSLLPMLENFTMALHVVMFIVILVVVLAVRPDKHTSTWVFTEFINNSGWDSSGVAWCLGLLTSSYIMVGADSVMHMAEDMKHPRTGIPRAMIGSLVLNGAMGFAMVLALLYAMGDLTEAISTPTGYPIIAIFLHIVRGNEIAASAMTATIITSAGVATVGIMATAVRTVWACARDDILPFSWWLKQLHPKRDTPVNALYVTMTLLVLLGLLNIASTAAFTAYTSLAVASLYVSYFMPIAALLYRRIRTPEKLQFGPWRISNGLGMACNIVSCIYLVFAFIFCMMPPYRPVETLNMNYAPVVLGGSMVLITIGWFFRRNTLKRE